jgi:hypothetical protein
MRQARHPVWIQGFGIPYNTWLELARAVLSANSMARLLVATVEEADAIAYGVYQLQDLVCKTKALSNQLLDEIRQAS